MNAKAVSVGMDLHEFGNQAVHVHASVGFARGAAIGRASSDEDRRAFGFGAVAQRLWRKATRQSEDDRQIENEPPSLKCLCCDAVHKSPNRLRRLQNI